MINNYKVKINGINEAIYTTKVRTSMNKTPTAMPYIIGESVGNTDIEIYSDTKIKSVLIRPLSLNIKYTFNSHTIKFTAPESAKLSVEINNDINTALGVFINKPVTRPENTTIEFSKGIHVIDYLELHDNDCLYLEKGAYLKGKIYAKGNNIKICGNGILSSEIFSDGNLIDKKYHFMLEAEHCSNCVISDITLIQSLNWNMRLNGCDNVDVSDVKIIGYRGNNDGIDVCGSRNVNVHDCFIRSTDDSLTVKGFNTGDVKNIHFYKCTLWNDYANPMRVGGIRENTAENIVYEDIDIIHNTAGYPCFAYLEGNRAKVDGIRIENVRIEDSNNAHLFDVRVKRNLWTTDDKTGYLKNISFKNIYLYGSEPKKYLPQDSVFAGFTEGNFIDGVTFENIFVYGKQMTSIEECRIDIRNYVKNVKFIYDGNPDGVVETQICLENMSLKKDGYYHGNVVMILKNQSERKLITKVRPEIYPDYTHAYNRFKPRKVSLSQDETKSLTYPVVLRPGKYLLAAEADNITVIPSWNVYELDLITKDIKYAPDYEITDSDGKKIASLRLGKDETGILCSANILNENSNIEVPTLSVFFCKNRKFKEGDAYFNSEETNEGHSAAISFSKKGHKTEPIMRNFEEIQWTLNNAPEYENIIRITADSNGRLYKDVFSTELRPHQFNNHYLATIINNLPVNLITIKSTTSGNTKNILLKIPYAEIGLKPSDDVCMEITVHPTLKNNIYTKDFSLFGSMSPAISTHMYCKTKL